MGSQDMHLSSALRSSRPPLPAQLVCTLPPPAEPPPQRLALSLLYQVMGQEDRITAERAEKKGGADDEEFERWQRSAQEEWERARARDAAAWERKRAQQEERWRQQQAQQRREWEEREVQEEQRWERQRELQQALWERALWQRGREQRAPPQPCHRHRHRQAQLLHPKTGVAGSDTHSSMPTSFMASLDRAEGEVRPESAKIHLLRIWRHQCTLPARREMQPSLQCCQW